MRSEIWEKVEPIFHAALDLSAEERSPYLRQICAGDAVLFSEVESLLHSFEKKSDFLGEPVFELGLEALNDKPQKNLTGSKIGFYNLLEKLGSGGMGDVYLALDTRLNRRVALKFLSEFLEDDHRAKRQFIREAQAVAMLEHPNICAVHAIEQTDNQNFIVMQYIEGTTLTESIEKETINLDEFKSLARQIVTAVAFAHSHGVIHRDLKPGNIMLTRSGQIKILDFGLATVVRQKQLIEESTSHSSNNGLVIGTVSYMSPEQLRGKRLDFRSDIFSLGVVLYELMAKTNPFSRPSQAETIAAVLSEETPALRESVPDFPKSLANLVEKCLQKDAEKRFQSAAEILVELDNTETEKVVRSSTKTRRNFFVKTAFAAVILLAVMAVYFLYNSFYSKRTIAVLPISSDVLQEEKKYLADGLAQGVIEKLSNLSDLNVKNESLSIRHQGRNPRDAGKELNVDAVFVGKITSRADGLFLESQLIRTSDGVLIGANEEKIDETKFVELPESIASWIIGKIQTKMTGEDINKFAKKDTESLKAKDLYLQGRYFLRTGKNGDGVEKAIRLFTEAKDIDQNFAKAWAGLADAYLSQSAPGVKRSVTPDKAFESAEKAAKKALDLDNTLCEAYHSLGMISLKYEWNWSKAEGYFRTAISRDAEFLPARSGLMSVLNIQGRYDEALEEAKRIQEVDPFPVTSEIQIAQIYYKKHDYQQTDKILSDLIERFPDNTRVKYVRVYQFLKTERFREAVEILEPMYQSNNEEDKVLAAAPLGFAYAKMGRRDDALKIIEDLGKFRKNNYVPAQEKALIYVALGNYDKVFEFLDQSCRERFSSLPGWVTDPIVEEVRSDARFAKIKECVNL